MNDWFLWRNVRCTEYGIHVLTQPPITLPAERTKFVNVPGRSGSLTVLEGEDVYDDLTLTAECIIRDSSRINEIAAYLKGASHVTFANRPGGYYQARIINQIPLDVILRGNPHRSFSVNFRCYPFWYESNVQPITLTTSGTTVNNPGNVPAEPVITITGSGEITLMVGTSIIELTDVNGFITLDTPLMEAYSDTASMNGSMSGDFPLLQPGANPISWTGNGESVVIQPNWRHLA